MCIQCESSLRIDLELKYAIRKPRKKLKRRFLQVLWTVFKVKLAIENFVKWAPKIIILDTSFDYYIYYLFMSSALKEVNIVVMFKLCDYVARILRLNKVKWYIECVKDCGNSRCSPFFMNINGFYNYIIVQLIIAVFHFTCCS